LGYDGTDWEIFYWDGSGTTRITDNAYRDLWIQINDRGDIVWMQDDGTDYEIFFAHIDTDNDGIADFDDNCPNSHNPAQQNIDNDTAGDVCDNDTIYGHVTGDIQEDVSIEINSLSCGGATYVGSTLTDSGGYYAFSVPASFGNGKYYAVGAKFGSCTFDPEFHYNIHIRTSCSEPVSYDFTATCSE